MNRAIGVTLLAIGAGIAGILGTTAVWALVFGAIGLWMVSERRVAVARTEGATVPVRTAQGDRH